MLINSTILHSCQQDLFHTFIFVFFSRFHFRLLVYSMICIFFIVMWLNTLSSVFRRAIGCLVLVNLLQNYTARSLHSSQNRYKVFYITYVRVRQYYLIIQDMAVVFCHYSLCARVTEICFSERRGLSLSIRDNWNRQDILMKDNSWYTAYIPWRNGRKCCELFIRTFKIHQSVLHKG